MDTLHRTDENVLREWIGLAHKIRTMQFVLARLATYEVGGFTLEDDEEFLEAPLSSWAVFYMSSALGHLSLWLEHSMPPEKPTEMTNGYVVFRPLLTIGRGGLESACQAFWILDEDASTPRLYRHVRLVLMDLHEEIKACGDDQVRSTLRDVESGYKEFLKKEGASSNRITTTEIINDVAGAMGDDPAVLLSMWRHASAASHGKHWLTIYDEVPAHGLNVEGASPGASRLMDAICIAGAAADILFAALTQYVETSEVDAADILLESTLRSLLELSRSPGHVKEKNDFVRSVLTNLAEMPGCDPTDNRTVADVFEESNGTSR